MTDNHWSLHPLHRRRPAAIGPSAPSTSSSGPTAHGRTGKSRGSTAPCRSSGPTDRSSSATTNEPRLWHPGLSTTTLDAATQLSEADPRSADCHEPVSRVHLARHPVEAVAGVAEAGHDVAELVEPLVQRRRHHGDRHVEPGEVRLQPRDALRRREQADRGDVGGAALEQQLDRRRQAAAGGEHRVEHVALAAGQVFGQPRGVRRRLAASPRRGPGRGSRPPRSAAAASCRRACRARRAGSARPAAWAPRAGCPWPAPPGYDLDRLGAHPSGGLVGQQRDQLVDQAAEGRRVGAGVAQRRSTCAPPADGRRRAGAFRGP